MFIVIQCDSGWLRMLILTYEFLYSAFRFEGVVVPGISRGTRKIRQFSWMWWI